MHTAPLDHYAGGGSVKKALKLATKVKQAPLSDPIAAGVALRMQALLNKGAELENLPSKGLNLPAAYAGDQRSQQALQRRLSEQQTGLGDPSRRKFMKQAAATAARQALPGLPTSALSVIDKLGQLNTIPPEAVRAELLRVVKAVAPKLRELMNIDSEDDLRFFDAGDALLTGDTGNIDDLTTLGLVNTAMEADELFGKSIPMSVFADYAKAANSGITRPSQLLGQIILNEYSATSGDEENLFDMVGSATEMIENILADKKMLKKLMATDDPLGEALTLVSRFVDNEHQHQLVSLLGPDAIDDVDIANLMQGYRDLYMDSQDEWEDSYYDLIDKLDKK